MSPQKTTTTLIGACAVGAALSLVLAGAGGAGSAGGGAAALAPTMPPRSTAIAAPSAASSASPASAPRPVRRATAREDAAARDEALCKRAAAVGPGGSEGLASSPSGDAAIVAATRRIDARLRASAEPFPLAVAAWLDPGHQAPSFRQRQERLARLAETTDDARVYALAFRECLKGVDDDAAPGCQALNARRWAQLDPGNAMPWVYALGDAVARGDAVGRDDALFQIASSSRIEERPFAIAQAILDHAGNDGAALVAANDLVSQAMGMSAAQKLPLYALVSACRADAREDANISQLCAETSDLLVQRSDTLALRRIGIALDFVLTDDADRRERLREETARLGTAPSPREAGGCAALRDARAFMRRAGEVGEVVALRERSGP